MNHWHSQKTDTCWKQNMWWLLNLLQSNVFSFNENENIFVAYRYRCRTYIVQYSHLRVPHCAEKHGKCVTYIICLLTLEILYFKLWNRTEMSKNPEKFHSSKTNRISVKWNSPLSWFDFPCEQPHQASPPLAVIIPSPSTTDSFKYSVAQTGVD